MKVKTTKKKLKTPIKIVQLVDDKYLLDYRVIGELIDIAFNESNQKNNDYAKEGKTYFGQFAWDGHIYDASIHVFKKYLEFRITYNSEMKEEKKNARKKV